ncbi:hypothetical protein PRZ48_014687 [Zasmidium cellare]|uniref:Uncharacterized protein n=1 Tax=Zasmidium cellare TaxID=395010 RepID=A0ABR0DZ04_ZASCE|nr:hypothetical protein PRZ48_014687 [Zasmidium cellare]
MARRKTTSSLRTTPVDRSARPTTFLDLPPELRNTIYELAFDSLVVFYPKPTPSNKKGRARYPGIIMASRQTFRECLLLYYSSVNLYFGATDKMLSFLAKLGAKKRTLLKNDVYFDADFEIIIDSPQPQPTIVPNATKQMAPIVRRMRDSGATLRPGVLKLRIRCWWGGRPISFLCWPDENAGFFSLPRELRDIIYEYALTMQVDLRMASPHAHNNGLLSTCKQTRSESLKLYYSLSTFRVSTQRHCIRFLCSGPPELRRLINDVEIETLCPGCKKHKYTAFKLDLASLRDRRVMIVMQRICNEKWLNEIHDILVTSGVFLRRDISKCEVYVWDGKRNVWIWTSKPEEEPMPSML